MTDDIAIKVEHVSKDFVLPHEKTSSLKSAFTGLYRKRSKRETAQHALQDIGFEIKKGEFFGIVGRNGSGKSTMLKILANIYQPTAGSVVTRGKLVPFIELGVGFNPELTGRENVYLNGAMLGFARDEIDTMYDDIVSFAELERFMDQKLKNYSSGMQVRLAFSMATRSEADILLIDEVLAVGDADFQRKCFDYFRQLKRDKKTVVFVSHDMDAVQEYCDRAVLIEKSKIISAGKTSTVTDKYRQLFNAEESTATDESDDAPSRWGNGGVVTEGLRISTSAEQVTIEQAIVVKDTLASPIVGLRIRSANGENVTGTNTKIEKLSLGTLKPAEKVKITWVFPNVLSEGTYTVDPAILSSDGITVQDWWDDAATFTVKKNRHIPYIIDPLFKVELTRSTDGHD